MLNVGFRNSGPRAYPAAINIIVLLLPITISPQAAILFIFGWRVLTCCDGGKTMRLSSFLEKELIYRKERQSYSTKLPKYK